MLELNLNSMQTLRNLVIVPADQAFCDAYLGANPLPERVDLWVSLKESQFLNTVRLEINQIDVWKLCEISTATAGYIIPLLLEKYPPTLMKKRILIFLEQEKVLPQYIFCITYNGKNEPYLFTQEKYNPGFVVEFGDRILICPR